MDGIPEKKKSGYALNVNLPIGIKCAVRKKINERTIIDENGCWNWQGNVKPGGYGNIRIENVTYNAHRISFAAFMGVIPEGLTIDHLCRNRKCLNPEHMEVVTQKENALRGESSPANNARKKYCKRGHDLIPLSEQRMARTSAKRHCPICERIDALEWNKNNRDRKNANNKRYNRKHRLLLNPRKKSKVMSMEQLRNEQDLMERRDEVGV